MNYKPLNPDFELRLNERFRNSQVMKMLGASLKHISPGKAEIELPNREDLCQSHGFIHGGIIGTLLDTACGYAAFSLSATNADVLTIEYKTNFLAPATGNMLLGRGRVLRHGKNVIVCEAEGLMIKNGREKLVAKMTATLMTVSISKQLPTNSTTTNRTETTTEAEY